MIELNALGHYIFRIYFYSAFHHLLTHKYTCIGNVSRNFINLLIMKIMSDRTFVIHIDYFFRCELPHYSLVLSCVKHIGSQFPQNTIAWIWDLKTA